MIVCELLDWEQIRSFLIKRKWLREHVGEKVFDLIIERKTHDLTGRLMYDLSLWIDGYKVAKQ